MSPEGSQACVNCFFVGERFGRLRCLRYPPTAYYDEESCSSCAITVPVDEDDWCGEYRPLAGGREEGSR